MAKKKVTEAPRAALTLRDLSDADLKDWRWPVKEGSRIYMRARVSVGMPVEMREAWDETKRKTGLSLSEIGRRLTRRDLVERVRPRGL